LKGHKNHEDEHHISKYEDKYTVHKYEDEHHIPKYEDKYTVHKYEDEHHIPKYEDKYTVPHILCNFIKKRIR
jgi:hypothetical protein